MSARPAAVLAHVEEELRALWAAPAHPGQVPKARACTMNLVLVAASVEDAREWVPVVDEVLEGTPARALVVGVDPEGPEGLEAKVAGVCTPAGGAALCSERVALVARGAVAGRLASVVGALSVTDVPTTLVWLAAVRAEDPVFTALAGDATRIVLDASSGSLAGLACVVRWLRSGAPAAPAKGMTASPARGMTQRVPGVADLAWVRLAPWQELCARVFDEPQLRSLADHVTGLTLVQDRREGPALGPHGTLLLGWLATRLGWKVTPPARDTQSPEGKLRLVRRDGGDIAVSLRCAKGAGGDSTLLAVKLEASHGDVSVRGEMSRDGEAVLWQFDVTSGSSAPRRIEQRVRLRDQSPAGLLDRTLHRSAHDPALEEAAAWAGELRGEELACG